MEHKITIARGHRFAWLYTGVIKPVVESFNAAITGVTLTCTATASISHPNFYNWAIEAEFENEQDKTLFLLSDIHSSQADLEKHLTRLQWYISDNETKLSAPLLQMFSKYVIT